MAKGVDSHLWKTVVNLWPKLENHCSWSIGDGLSVKFCDDAWIDIGLRIKDLGLQVPQQWRHVKVSEFVDEEGRWNLNEPSNFLPPEVLHRIEVVPPLDMNSGPDVKCCLDKEHGNLSIASMYQALCDFEDDHNESIWSNIWKLRVPERVRYFVWLMNHNRLLTNYNKSKMGLGNASCSLCGCVAETLLHVMRDCRNQFFAGDYKAWISFNYKNEAGWRLEATWSSLWAVACYFIWMRRNKYIHTEGFSGPSNQVHHILQHVKNYHVAESTLQIVENKCSSIVQVKWLPPLEGWVKLNTDGSCQEGGRIGCGGVIRGSDGEWLGGYAKFIGYGNAYLAELWGVLEGLKHVRRLNFSSCGASY
jgi:hypothetical protein